MSMMSPDEMHSIFQQTIIANPHRELSRK